MHNIATHPKRPEILYFSPKSQFLASLLCKIVRPFFDNATFNISQEKCYLCYLFKTKIYYRMSFKLYQVASGKEEEKEKENSIYPISQKIPNRTEIRN